jgi:hypothetical protein
MISGTRHRVSAETASTPRGGLAAVYSQHLDPITDTARKVRRAAERLDALLGNAVFVIGCVREEGRTALTDVEADYLALLDAELRTVVEEVHRLAVQRHSLAITAHEG